MSVFKSLDSPSAGQGLLAGRGTVKSICSQVGNWLLTATRERLSCLRGQRWTEIVQPDKNVLRKRASIRHCQEYLIHKESAGPAMGGMSWQGGKISDAPADMKLEVMMVPVFRYSLIALFGMCALAGVLFLGLPTMDFLAAPEVRMLAFYGSNFVVLSGLIVFVLVVSIRRRQDDESLYRLGDHRAMDMISDRQTSRE